MSESTPPKWNPGEHVPMQPGVIFDPAPFPPERCPPWPWWWWWCRHHWPPWDPLFPPDLIEQIDPADMIELQRIQLEAQREAFNHEVDIQMRAIERQRSILKKYR
jgi:hypothetical protein